MNQDLTPSASPPLRFLRVKRRRLQRHFHLSGTARTRAALPPTSRPSSGRAALCRGRRRCGILPRRFWGAWLLPLPGSVGVWEGGRFLPQRNAKIVRNARIMLYNGSMRKVTSIILVVVAVSCNAFARGSDGVPCLCEIVPTNETYSLISSTVVCSIIRLGQNTQQGVAFSVRAGRGGVTWAL